MTGFGKASRAGVGAFVLLVTGLHVGRPGLDPVQHRISEYANGSGSFVMTTAFAVWSVSLLLTSVATMAARSERRVGVVAVGVLLAVAGAGAAVSAICPTGTSAGEVPAGHSLTTANHMHDVASGALGLALWGAATLSVVAMGDSRARRRAIVLLGAALLAALVFSDVGFGLGGVRQRALVLTACAWQLIWLDVLERASLGDTR